MAVDECKGNDVYVESVMSWILFGHKPSGLFPNKKQLEASLILAADDTSTTVEPRPGLNLDSLAWTIHSIERLIAGLDARAIKSDAAALAKAQNQMNTLKLHREEMD